MEVTTDEILEMYNEEFEKTIEIAGINISILEFQPDSECEGTIIGVPGGPGMPKEHLLPLAMFRNKGYRVVIYDTHNVGKSDDHEEPYQMETFRTVLSDLCSRYESVILTGHSWGSMLSLDLLCKENEVADGLITMAPLFDTQENIQIAETLRASYLPTSDLEYMINCERNQDYEDDKRYEELARSIDEEFGFIPPIPEFVEDMAFYRFNEEMYESMWGPEEFVLSENSVLENWGVKDELRNISVPTLLITGKRDMFGYHDLYEASEKIDGSTTVKVIEEGSHTFFWEQPEESLEVLDSWLQDWSEKDS